MWNNEWKKGVDYPSWGDTEVYKKTISGGYLYMGESPRDAYKRVATLAQPTLDWCVYKQQTYFSVFL